MPTAAPIERLIASIWFSGTGAATIAATDNPVTTPGALTVCSTTLEISYLATSSVRSSEDISAPVLSSRRYPKIDPSSSTLIEVPMSTFEAVPGIPPTDPEDVAFFTSRMRASSRMTP